MYLIFGMIICICRVLQAMHHSIILHSGATIPAIPHSTPPTLITKAQPKPTQQLAQVHNPTWATHILTALRLLSLVTIMVQYIHKVSRCVQFWYFDIVSFLRKVSYFSCTFQHSCWDVHALW